MDTHNQPYTQFTEREIEAMVSYIDFAERTALDDTHIKRDQDPDLNIDTVKKLLIERTAYRELLRRIHEINNVPPVNTGAWEEMLSNEIAKIEYVLAEPDPDWIYAYVDGRKEPVGRVWRKMAFATDHVRRVQALFRDYPSNLTYFITIAPNTEGDT